MLKRKMTFKKNVQVLNEGDKKVICEFISVNYREYKLNWLLNKCKINRTVYYNFKKNKKRRSY